MQTEHAAVSDGRVDMGNAGIAIRALVVLLAVVFGAWSGTASADAEMKLAGFADVPPSGAGGTLSLPLAAGATPVTINLTFGVPSLKVPVEITHSTHVESETGLPVAVTDGDRVTVEAIVVQGVLRASRLKVDEFPELELNGTVKGLPAAGVTLPLAAGATADLVVTLGTSGIDVPVRLTSKTKVHGQSLTIDNGDKVKIEAGVQNNLVVATEIKR
jgi:hypothetical protein